MIKTIRTSFFIFLLFSSCLSLKAQHTQFQTGDLFLGQGLGIIQWRDSNGILIKKINTGDGGANGNGVGLCIHPVTGQLWVTNYNEYNSVRGIRIVNTDGTPGNAINIYTYQKSPTAITFDKLGNAYIGGLWNDTGDQIVKISPAGVILDHYPVSSDGYVWGPQCIDMSCNDSIIYYTSGTPRVKRYNVITRQQLPDFANLTGSVSWLLGIRLLPDNNMLVVAADNVIFRLNAAGVIIKTYTPTNLCGFAEIAGTQDGKSFWVGGLAGYGPMYKFDITSGNVQNYFLADPVNQGITIHGIAVYGDRVKNCLSTNPDTGNTKSMNVYPNPSHGNFTLKTNLTGKIIIKVYSNLGQPVFSKEYNFTGANNKIPVNLRNLAAGVYLVQIINEGKLSSQKIIVN